MPRARAYLLGLILAGTGVRVGIALTAGGLQFDIDSWRALRAAFAAHPLHFYGLVNPGQMFHWPYPSGFLPLMLAMSGLSDLVGGFTHLIRLPAVAADAGLTVAVWHGLRGRSSERTRLAAAALVALGPVFIVISSYAAQIDAVAILPCVVAVLIWERVPAGRRALFAGLLIGLGGAIKTVPLVTVLVLVPSVRSRQELVILLSAAAAVVLAACLPFVLADPTGVARILHYQGVPGLGGLSLVVQPDLAANWLSYPVPYTSVVKFAFVDHAILLNVAVLAAFAAYAVKVRLAPRPGAALLFLLLITFGSGFFFQYLVWVVPFLLLAGHVRSAAALQVAVVGPMLMFYAGPWRDHTIVTLYVGIMLLGWLGWAAGVMLLARQSTRSATA